MTSARTIRFIAPWESSRAVVRLPDVPRDDVVLLFVESLAKGAQLPWHRHKLVLVLSAMHHFAESLRAEGHRVEIRRAATYGDAIGEAARAHGATRVLITRPRERDQVAAWAQLRDTLAREGVRVLVREDGGFVATPEQFARWAEGRKELRMEWFYREMRRAHQVLVEPDGSPTGGAWNFDVENRKPWPKGRAVPAPWREEPDALTRRIMSRVARWHGPWAKVDGFALPVTRAGALHWLERFVVERLPEFGPYEDAMVAGAPDLLHSTLAPLLNVGLLHPLEVVRRAERAYRDGHVPIASAEGFIRQVLGWREYVRGIYWLMPELEGANALGARLPLPHWYWDPDGQGESAYPGAPAGHPCDMACLGDSLRLVRDHGRVHHIPRLMVQANFATLLGVDPAELNRWFHAAFTDASHWVTTPNVVGMGSWGDGGRIMSKPYVASGAYVHRMSNHCTGCRYDPKQRTGDDACPLTVLYWDWLATHRERFVRHPRMALMVKQLDRIPPAELSDVRRQASLFRDRLSYEDREVNRVRERPRAGSPSLA